MKKLLVAAVTAALLGLVPVFALAPSEAASSTKYVATQKTLSDAIGRAIELNSKQKAEIRSVVAANPYAEKFICTGIRLEGQPQRMNLVVRKRAKVACEYAKSLNPQLSTWYQSKETKAASYNGRVLLMLKTPKEFADAVPRGYVETDSIDFEINPDYQVGKLCGPNFWWQVLGLDKNDNPAYLKCSSNNVGVFMIDSRLPKFDSKTNKPLVPEVVPAKSQLLLAPNLYVVPQVTSAAPKAQRSAGAFDDYSMCKIAEAGGVKARPDKTFGFPLPSSRPRLTENFKILVVPVQFTDHQATSKPADDLADVVSALGDFYTRAASVPVSFDWTIPETYYQMGRTIDSFNLNVKFDAPGGFWSVYKPYVEAAMALADDDYDFSQYDAVILEEPRSVTDAEQNSYVPVVPENGTRALTKDGLVNALLLTGNDQYRNISNWIHEFGHLLGLPDRNWSAGVAAGFDVMWGSYSAPELSAWSRWQLEILQDKQVDCKTDDAASTHWLRPVAWTGEHQKAVVIPVSGHEVIVVESRRRQGYDALLGKESEGAYVYRIDTSALMYEADTKKNVNVVAPARADLSDGWALDASLKLGESVTSDGWTITVKETGAFGDVVEVKKG